MKVRLHFFEQAMKQDILIVFRDLKLCDLSSTNVVHESKKLQLSLLNYQT